MTQLPLPAEWARILDETPGPAPLARNRPQNAPKVGPKEFITLWQESATLDEFCERTGYRRQSASKRACWYREMGIALKYMPRKADTRSLDKPALRTLASELGGFSGPKEGNNDDQG